MTRETVDIRKMLRAADAQRRAGNHARAVQIYDRVAEHYASQGRHVHAVAISKQLLALIDEAIPVMAPLYRHVWQRLAASYDSLQMRVEAHDAQDRWEALAEAEAQLPPSGYDPLN